MLAAAALRTQEDVWRLIHEAEAEPAWLVREHLAEPARSRVVQCAEEVTRFKGYLEGMASVNRDLVQIRDGHTSREMLRSDFEERIAELLKLTEPVKQVMLEFLDFAQGLRSVTQ